MGRHGETKYNGDKEYKPDSIWYESSGTLQENGYVKDTGVNKTYRLSTGAKRIAELKKNPDYKLHRVESSSTTGKKRDWLYEFVDKDNYAIIFQLGDLYKKGGNMSKKEKKPKVVYTQFEEEDYEFGKGGGVKKGSFAALAKKRLEQLRKEIRAERISTGELLELRTLTKYIKAGDVELLEAAGVKEFEDDEDWGVYVDGELVEDGFDSKKQAETWANEHGYENYTTETYAKGGLVGVTKKTAKRTAEIISGAFGSNNKFHYSIGGL